MRHGNKNRCSSKKTRHSQICFFSERENNIPLTNVIKILGMDVCPGNNHFNLKWCWSGIQCLMFLGGISRFQKKKENPKAGDVSFVLFISFAVAILFSLSSCRRFSFTKIKFYIDNLFLLNILEAAFAWACFFVFWRHTLHGGYSGVLCVSRRWT